MSKRPIPAAAAVVMSGRTRKDIAATVGVNEHTFGRILNGHVTAWPALRQKLAHELGVPESVLFAEDYVTASRAAQGLPPTVVDADALAAVGRALRGGDAA